MRLAPLELRDARRFVDLHHRHSEPTHGWRFGTSLIDGAVIVGVAVVGRPVAPGWDKLMVVEITRLCTLEQRNACSMLYGAVCRAAKALGFQLAITYTLANREETGASLRASGFRPTAFIEGRNWSRTKRMRALKNVQDRIRWERAL